MVLQCHDTADVGAAPRLNPRWLTKLGCEVPVNYGEGWSALRSKFRKHISELSRRVSGRWELARDEAIERTADTNKAISRPCTEALNPETPKP